MKQIRIFKYFVILIGLSLTASLYAIELDPGGNRIEEGLEYYNQGEYLESLKNIRKQSLISLRILD